MKLRFLVAIFVVVWVVIITRLYYFTIRSNGIYEELSSRNSTKTDYIYPSRGIIYDRNLNPLAINKIGFSVKLVPRLNTKKKIGILDEKLKLIVKFLPTQNFEKLKQAYIKSDSPYNHESIKVVDFVQYEQMLPSYTLLSLDPLITIEPSTLREYPNKELGAHVVGYVAKISQEELEKLDRATPNAYVGKDGLEKQYNTELQGEPGYRVYKVNAYNEDVGEIEVKEPSINHNLVTSIDIRLQRLLSEQYTDKTGAAVVMNAQTGEILAAASYPEYDINSFVRGLTGEEWTKLSSDVDHALSNKLTKGLYPPGSVIKPGVALSFLDGGVVDEHSSISCAGFVEYGGRKFRDWKKEGHGTVDIRKAIRESCDVFFYKLSPVAGIDKISKMLKKLGLGSKSGVDLPGEFAGVVPDREWKSKRFHKGWYIGDTLITAIGQGSMIMTPMQIARYTAILATGKDTQPRFAKKIGNKEMNATSIEVFAEADKKNLAIIRDGMYQVCNVPGGTAYGSLGGLKVKVAGKTGTAQVYTIPQSEINRLKEDQLQYYQRSHAWLTTYAPYDKPKYVITALVEHGGHGGSEAGPVVSELYKKMIELGYFKESNISK